MSIYAYKTVIQKRSKRSNTNIFQGADGSYKPLENKEQRFLL